jgi:hypothetical protein
LNAEGDLVKFDSSEFENMGITNPDLLYSTDNLTDNVLSIDDYPLFTWYYEYPYFPLLLSDEAILHLSSQNEDGSITYPWQLGDLINVVTNDGQGYEETGGVSYPDGSYVEGPPAAVPPADEEETPGGGTDGSGIRSYKRVLNIQPTADFTASETSIRSVFSKYDVQIVNMTSTQFNASIEDINAMYDMVFIGSGAGRFNFYGGYTVFNNNYNLNRYLYFNEGDSIWINDGTAKTEYYRGNDITKQKQGELQSFLAAGYPVIVDSGMYQLTGVKSNTNIYNFIYNVKKNLPNNFFNLATYTGGTSSTRLSFLIKLTYALSITRPLITLANPIVEDASGVNYVYVDPDTDTLKIQFAITPKGRIPSSYTYNAYLYIDKNGDGIFDESERLNVVSSDGSTWEGLSESKYKTYTYNYNMADLNGVYQWKIVVKRTDKPEIRSCVSGYAANSLKQNINILQITDSAYSLKSSINNTSSLIYKYGSESKLQDYNLVFETMTVPEFEQMYMEEPYTSATADVTNKLSGYHMLIMDNPSDVIDNSYGALNNIKDEVGKGLSILFTKDALGYGNQNNYYGTEQTSFLSYHTYNYINNLAYKRYNYKDQYYIFSSLSSNGDLTKSTTYNTTYLTKANEGAITRYPYQINQAIEIAPNSYSNHVTVDYDLAAGQKMVGWYCLSDQKSPVVAKEMKLGTTDANLYKGIYSSSPNDVKNNYYLFSYGLCYYSGIKLSDADALGKTDEIKLFINTIIAARKATNRVVSTPPVITIKKPSLDDGTAVEKTITVTSEDITGTDFILHFEISESTSRMDLDIKLNDLDPTGSWDDIIYKVDTYGNLGPAISINNLDKVVDKDITYAIKIPLDEMIGTNKLSFKARNMEGAAGTLEVNLIYDQLPEIVIDDPHPINNETADKDYIYVDIDFNSIDTSEDSMNEANQLRVVFTVGESNTNVLLSVTSEGNPLTDGSGDEVMIYPASDDMGTELNLTEAHPIGQYIMYIPMSLMKNHNSREITITATNLDGKVGKKSVTLIRRSLFPLD